MRTTLRNSAIKCTLAIHFLAFISLVFSLLPFFIYRVIGSFANHRWNNSSFHEHIFSSLYLVHSPINEFVVFIFAPVESGFFFFCFIRGFMGFCEVFVLVLRKGCKTKVGSSVLQINRLPVCFLDHNMVSQTFHLTY